MRGKVGKVCDEKYVLMMDMEHIMADGVRGSLVIEELGELYEDKRLGGVELE